MAANGGGRVSAPPLVFWCRQSIHDDIKRAERERIAAKIQQLYAGRKEVPWRDLYDLVLELRSLETK